MLNVNIKETGIGKPSATVEEGETTHFYKDILEGLRSTPKYLPSKYFYDAAGDRIFQEIMNCEAYYPFNCELEIFSAKTAELAKFITAPGDAFDLIELGPGDCTKSSYLLRHLVNEGIQFNYVPIDISANIIQSLNTALPNEIKGLRVAGLNGEYLRMLQQTSRSSKNRKVLLFLGSNLGNMLPGAALALSQALRGCLLPGDLAIIGLDLKKDPRVVLAAYNDTEGLTRRFNLNLLERINRELNGNFDISKFEHFPTYDPASGACKSYIVSIEDQMLSIGLHSNREIIRLKKGESIFMEVSQKYDIEEIKLLAQSAGFSVGGYFYDSKHWFVDTIWEVI